uniref:non-specific serine/threonine protein kinase n=1 Tax=Steinernema glaseri TaxID=37863 RepID=A0A1I7YMB7_9BILA
MPPKKKTAKVYQMAVDVPEGTSVGNGDFVVGKQFAKGGFGKIYQGTSKKTNSKVVIKVEPHENGPLFNEIAVFIRCMKATMLEAWKKESGVKFLGLPEYLGSGLFQHGGEQMRFLAMPMYACSMENIRAKKPEMKLTDVFQVTHCMLTALEYLHSQHIVHADMKADNILMIDPKRFDRTVLVDFGLAKRIPAPREKPDPKKAHNGTAIFTSIDAHRGCAPSYRGDIEILAYNVIYWVTGSLPWQQYETELENVAAAKKRLLSGKKKALEEDFEELPVAASNFVVDLLEVVETTKYDQRLSYKALLKMLETANGVTTTTPARRRTRASLAAPVIATPPRKAKTLKTPKITPQVPAASSSRRTAASTARTKPANSIIPGLRGRQYKPRLAKEEKEVATPVEATEKPKRAPREKKVTATPAPPPSTRTLRSSSARRPGPSKRAVKDVEEDQEDQSPEFTSPPKRYKLSQDEEQVSSPPNLDDMDSSASNSPVVASASRRTRRILESSAEEDPICSTFKNPKSPARIFQTSITSIEDENTSSSSRRSRKSVITTSTEEPANTSQSDGSFLNSSADTKSCEVVPETPESGSLSAALDLNVTGSTDSLSPLPIGISPLSKNNLAARIPGVLNMRNVRRSVYHRIVSKYHKRPSIGRRPLF